MENTGSVMIANFKCTYSIYKRRESVLDLYLASRILWRPTWAQVEQPLPFVACQMKDCRRESTGRFFSSTQTESLGGEGEGVWAHWAGGWRRNFSYRAVSPPPVWHPLAGQHYQDVKINTLQCTVSGYKIYRENPGTIFTHKCLSL